jgi:hypothetical protein
MNENELVEFLNGFKKRQYMKKPHLMRLKIELNDEEKHALLWGAEQLDISQSCFARTAMIFGLGFISMFIDDEEKLKKIFPDESISSPTPLPSLHVPVIYQ